VLRLAFLCLTAIVASVLLPSAASAGSITSISVSGPGGFGFGAVDSYNSADAYGVLYFTSVDPIIVSVQVDGPGQYVILFLPGEPASSDVGAVYNGTGVVWTSMLFAGEGVDGANSLNSYLDSTSNGPNLSWLGGDSPVPIDGLLACVFTFVTCQAGTFSTSVTPNAPGPQNSDPPGAPEPTSLVLMGIGSATLLLVSARRRLSARLGRRSAGTAVAAD